MNNWKFKYCILVCVLGALRILAPFSAPAWAQEEVDTEPPAWMKIIEESGLADSAGEQEDAVIDDSADNLPDVETVVREGADLEAMSEAVNVGAPRGASSARSQQSIRDEAFEAAKTGLFPLQPEQIRQMLDYYDQTVKSVEEPVKGFPEPEVVVHTLSLDPGVMPPNINVALGHVTTLNILDVTGAPWPVHDVSWAGDFEVVEPQEGGHMIRISPMAEYAYGNLSIRLLTLKTPITFSLRSSTEKVHYRMDVRIPEYGPHAEASLIDGGMQLVAGSPTMINVLDGAVPSNAQRMEVSGADGRTTAYRLNGMLYVRTPLNLLSPGWQSSVSSADGMNVYSLNETPVILLSDRGKFTRATITEKKDIFDE